MCIQVSESPITLLGAPCAVEALGCSLVSLVLNPALSIILVTLWSVSQRLPDTVNFVD